MQQSKNNKHADRFTTATKVKLECWLLLVRLLCG